MASLSAITIHQTLKQQNISLLNVSDFQKLFHISNTNTAYKTLQRLTRKSLLHRLSPGKYLVTDLHPDKFTIANFLYQPSYISLESALNHYGILAQFPYTITSVTVNRAKTIDNHTLYQYAHLSPQLFWGFEKQQNFLIASPEKALLDSLYFKAKGLNNLVLDELDFSTISIPQLKKLASQIPIPQLNKYLQQIYQHA